jgi:hypothetical protein
MKQIAQQLEAEMAKAVSLIISASHAAATDAVDEAFGLTQQRRQTKTKPGSNRSALERAPATPRRSAAEIKSLEENLLQTVSATPGESMNVLAPRVGATPSQLQVPIARLKNGGRIKTVGERQFTRYFPIECAMDGDETADG